jgi:NhaP-type Na+/H+ or K+/H+ antiporter
MICGIVLEKYKCSFGHEAAYTILFGMLISFIAWEVGRNKLVDLLKFSDDTFFFICLPPIVFASGYNMHRAQFFMNLAPVIVFGLLGTFICFGTFSAITIYLKDLGFM